jgi:HicB family
LAAGHGLRPLVRVTFHNGTITSHTRIPPELHRQVNLAASISGKSLNAWVAEQLQAAVARIKSIKAAKATGKGKRKSQRAEKHA